MTTVTVESMSKMFKIHKRSARAKLYGLVQAGKATQLNDRVGPNNPGVYELHIPLKNLLMNQSDIQRILNGKTSYKHFCADPFNLGKGAR